MIYLFIIILFILTISCSPYLFDINKNESEIINGKIKGDFRNFEQINDNSFILKDSVLVNLKAFNVTNNQVKFLVRFLEENKILITLRTTQIEYYKNLGIKINIVGKNYFIYKNNILIKNGIYEQRNNTILFDITNYGKKLKIKLNCTDIDIENIDIPNTEYLFFENYKNNKVEILGIEYKNLKKIL